MKIEYSNDILERINGGYKITTDAFKIGEAAVLGMLYEVSTSPSPGLVSPYSNGAHTDMDFFTFLNSTASIAYSMYLCAQIGMDYDKDILKRVRTVGIQAERNMMRATLGVNTQKGLLFLAGIVCAAAGACIRNNEEVNRNNISKKSSEISKGIVERELKGLRKEGKLSNGERLYLKYNLTGIRGEIERGLPSVINVGLPSLEDALRFGLNKGDALCSTLIALMKVVEDTTVVNRCGIEGLNLMKKEAEKALNLGCMKTEDGRKHIKHMEKLFVENNISPGGVADLLAITVMIKKLELDFGGGQSEKPA